MKYGESTFDILYPCCSRSRNCSDAWNADVTKDSMLHIDDNCIFAKL